MEQSRHIAQLIGVLSLMLSATMLYGQVDSSSLNNSIAKGTWALQFSISSDFTLQSFNGSMLSAKYHVSAENAIRFGISGGLSVSSSRPAYTHDYDDDEDIGLVAEYLFYSQPRPEIFLFWGIGPVVEFSRSYSEHTYEYPPSSSTTTDRTHVWALGPSAVVGVEWFATRWLSLHAEYRLQGLYARIKNTSEYKISNSPPSTYSVVSERFRFSASPVRLGLSVYL